MNPSQLAVFMLRLIQLPERVDSVSRQNIDFEENKKI